MRRSNRGLKILIFGSIAGLYLGAVGSVALHETASRNFMWKPSAALPCEYYQEKYGTSEGWQYQDINGVWQDCEQAKIYTLRPVDASPSPQP